ncbi:MAG: hypothetical protein NC548_52965 [Lachnospiraceae bacterium]|nr:hypothetical protein [Lachnospiraceae bacterium]
MKNQPSKGVFWVIDGLLLAFPFTENSFDSGLAKSGDTYAHKKLWSAISLQRCNKPYNYYPRGRVEITSRGTAILYMNPNVDEALIPEIMLQFGLSEYPKVIYDNSNHYKCYLDDGWKKP